jgi:GNAT superfamily N-acetyltransferase
MDRSKLKQIIKTLIQESNSIEITSEAEEEYEYFTAKLEGNKVGEVEIEEQYLDFLLEEWIAEDYAEFKEEVDAWEKDLNGEETIYVVSHVTTSKEYRGEGIASRLLDKALSDDKEYILNASPMGTATTLDTLIRLYSNVGFKEMFNQGNNTVMYRHKIK